MKKFLGILAAAMVAVISVFNLSGNYKNSAEPQYFYNSQIKNQIVNGNENTLETIEILLDNNTNLYTELDYLQLFNFTDGSEIHVKTNNEYINTNLDLSLTTKTIEFSSIFSVIFNTNTNQFTIFIENNGGTTESPFIFKLENDTTLGTINIPKNTWVYTDPTNQESDLLEINGFKITNCVLDDTLDYLNQQLTPYIGTVEIEDPTPEEPTTPLTQIGSIITDTIGWFTNIFTGLSAAFYINGELTTWGTVLFIGVAITLIAMVLKWLISLIKGV